MLKQLLAGLAVYACCAGPALARPTVIAELGSSPLLGTSTSTAEMRSRVARNEGILSAAATKAGLTAGEYAQFRAAIDSSRLAWVTVPRHLDVMTWQSGGTVYALHDVVIPAQTHGWEVDIPQGRHILAVYMPAKCGNLSLVRRTAPAIARRPHHTRVLALHAAPAAAPVVAPLVAPAAAPVAPPVADTAPAPAPAVVAESEFPPAPAVAAAHHFSLLPVLFGLAGIAGAASSGHNGSPAAAPINACP